MTAESRELNTYTHVKLLRTSCLFQKNQIIKSKHKTWHENEFIPIKMKISFKQKTQNMERK